MKITVTAAALPASVKGFSAWDKQGDRYIVMINADMPQEQQEETLGHELRHIENNDHQRLRVNVDLLENERHRTA